MARILVVDDDADILLLARKILATSNHDVMTAESAIAAIDTMNQFDFDLLITDANMPQYTGFDLLKTLRNQPKFNSIPVIMLTARREKKDIDLAITLGADDYVLKPVDAILLVAKVEQILQKFHQTRPSAEIGSASSFAQGNLNVPITMHGVSELGLVFRGPHSLTEGRLLKLDTPLFAEIGIDPPHLKVLSSIPTSDDPQLYEVRVNFVGANDAILQKVRAWILKTQAQTRKAV